MTACTPRRLIVIGDAMCDAYTSCDPVKISPEAPVPILKFLSTAHNPGGAANVAKNLAHLGNDVTLIATIGDDDQGEILKERLKSFGVRCHRLIVVPERPTTFKTRFIAHKQQLLRLDRETTEPLPHDVYAEIYAAFIAELSDADGVVISDYNKGLLSEELTQQIIAAAKVQKKLVLGDPKGSSFAKYTGIDLLTPNRREAEQVSGLTLAAVDNVERCLRVLATSLRAKIVITMGEEGLSCCDETGVSAHFRSETKEVSDVTGAGDTTIAFLAYFLVNNVPYVSAAYLSNIAGGISVKKFGAAEVSIAEVIFELEHKNFLSFKLKETGFLPQLLSRHRRKKQRIVFTNGCFDMLHFGHVKFFETAKSFGDLLIVGVNSDRSVRRIKGENRPLILERQRLYLLASLEFIDYIVVFDEDTPENLISIVKPDVLVKYGNHEHIVGAEMVKQYGGQVKRIPDDAQHAHLQMIEEL